jgi:hypothetical protein
VGDGKEDSQGGETMKRMTRRNAICGFALAGLGFGCGGANPFIWVPAILNGGESKAPAEFPLAVHPKKKDAKVVVLVSGKIGLHPDLAGVDRVLNAELITVMDARAKENEEKIQILKMPKIDEFKSQNPNWRPLHPYDLGKSIAEGVDYVIDVEIVDMDLYKPGTSRWLQGRATVTVCVYDLTKPLKEAAFKKDVDFEYPRGREVEIEQRGEGSRAQISKFRMEFVQRMASDISIFFAAHTGHPQID